jgi:hypothetical protein
VPALTHFEKLRGKTSQSEKRKGKIGKPTQKKINEQNELPSTRYDAPLFLNLILVPTC